MRELREIRPDVWLLDVHQFGVPEQGGVYILRGKPAALVESGTSLARDRIIAVLDELSLPRTDVEWIFVTHVHLDHAGGAGVLLPDLPQAKVVVHERGVNHLRDPSRLVASVKEAVRDRFHLYGTVAPIPAGRLHVARQGELFELAPFRIRAVDAPGHAPHHLCFWEEHRRLLFPGDAAGLYLGGRLLPTTVPPSFDLDLSLTTLKGLMELQPEALLFTHFGPGPSDLLARYAQLLPAWVERVARLRKSHPQEEALVHAVLAEIQEEGWASTGSAREDLGMSVRGVLGYLAREERT